MRKVILYIAVSIDGYIADAGGSVDWLDEFATAGESDYGYSAFYESIDTTLMGRATYEQVIGFDVPFPYRDKTNYVFSSTPIRETHHATWGGSDAVSFVRDLKKPEGVGIWLIGGAGLNAALSDAGLIDRMMISVIPIALGSGISLFRGARTTPVWELRDSTVFENGVVQLSYERRDVRPAVGEPVA